MCGEESGELRTNAEILGQREFTDRFRNFSSKTAAEEQILGNLHSKQNLTCGARLTSASELAKEKYVLRFLKMACPLVQSCCRDRVRNAAGVVQLGSGHPAIHNNDSLANALTDLVTYKEFWDKMEALCFQKK